MKAEETSMVLSSHIGSRFDFGSRSSLGLFSLWFLAVSLGLAGCEKQAEKPAEQSEAENKANNSSAPSPLEPEVSRAVEQATSGEQAARTTGQKGGPPPNGVFQPKEADEQILVGDLPKLTIGSEGQEPRVLLRAPAKSEAKKQATLQVMLELGNQQLAVELGTVWEVKPRPLVNTDTAAPAGGNGNAVIGKVTSVNLMAQDGGAPQGVKDALSAALKGSELTYTVSAEGLPSNFAYAKGANKSGEMTEVLLAARDALATLVQPFPDKPVGKDAYWMVTSRKGLWGLDMITYDMVKVLQVEQDGVLLSVESKRYSVGSRFDPPLVKADVPLSLVQLDAPGQAQIKWQPGSLLPLRGRMNSTVSAGVTLPGADQGTGPQLIEGGFAGDFKLQP